MEATPQHRFAVVRMSGMRGGRAKREGWKGKEGREVPVIFGQ